MLSIKCQKSLSVESAWVTMPPLRLGKVPSGLGTADLFVTIQDDEAPILRVDLYADPSPFVKQDAMIWGERGFVGFGNSVYIIDPKTQSGSALRLGAISRTFTPRRNISWLPPAAVCFASHQSERYCGKPPALRWMV